jgi:hypothetical protein
MSERTLLVTVCAGDEVCYPCAGFSKSGGDCDIFSERVRHGAETWEGKRCGQCLEAEVDAGILLARAEAAEQRAQVAEKALEMASADAMNPEWMAQTYIALAKEATT